MNATARNLRRLVDMRHLVAYVRSGELNLTTRQMAVMLIVALTEGPHTVTGLARTLGIGKPPVSRLITTLSLAGLMHRRRDPEDGRNVFAELTPAGVAFLDRLEALRG